MYIKVRVIANAGKEVFEVLKENSFKISVKLPAKQNLANRRVVELVAQHFHVSVARVRIINGHQSPSKLLSITD